MSVKIYHNPRCRKSREALQLLEEKKVRFEVINYLDEVPSIQELFDVLKMLDMKPIDLVRKNEQIWKDNYKGKLLSDAEIIEAMHQNSKLIERPIVVNNQKAVIGRPLENVLEIISL